MPLSVRPATPADHAVVVAFNARLAEETEGRSLPADVLAAGVAAALADPVAKGPYFLAERDGAIVGQVGVTFEFSDWRNGWFWWIQSVYIRKEARGQGVFRSLYEHVADRARATPGVIGLRLYVEHDNTAAQETYLRLGMTRTSYLLLERYPI